MNEEEEAKLRKVLKEMKNATESCLMIPSVRNSREHESTCNACKYKGKGFKIVSQHDRSGGFRID